MKNKCEWCEERRYKTLTHIMNSEKSVFAIDFDDYDEEPLLDIIHKPHGDVFWEVQFAIKINYCPFCGKKLESKGE